jgi:hypothetical protein
VSAALQSRAEVAKLARLLSAEDSRFTALTALPAEDLRVLRDQVVAVLYDSDVAALHRAVSASRLLPGAVSAAIAQKAFGPVLCARVAGLAPVETAVDVAKRLPIPFLADVAVAMDPRRAVDVIGAIPTDRVVAVAAELARRDEHVTMGGFVSHLDDAAIYACFAVLSDGDLLRTGFLMDDKARLDTVIGLLPPERLEGLVNTAHDEELWEQAIDLLEHLSDEHHQRLAAVIAAQDDERRTAMINAVGRDRIPKELR